MLGWLLVKGLGFAGWWILCNKGDLKGLGLDYLGSWVGNFILRDCGRVRFGVLGDCGCLFCSFVFVKWKG